MDYRMFVERISDDQNSFERFCQAALPLCALQGKAKTNFKSGPQGGPFDGETVGAFGGREGTILFEYKGGKDRNKIKDDLLDNKLLRADRDRPGAAAYVLIMGNDRPTTKFETDINTFISTHKLPFTFICLPPDVVKQWISAHPSLLDTLFPGDRTPTMEEFIETLAGQGAPVSFRNYKNLDNLYVPPQEYDRIIEVLRKKRIVFIIGEPHVGKTFTATRIMRHFNVCHRKQAHWLLPKEYGREPGPDRAGRDSSEKPDSILALLEGKVGDGKITYIEDIFGRTSDEEVRWDRPRPQDVLYELINYMKHNGRDGMVIVTSREKLFDKALAADPQLNDFIVRLGAESRIQLQLDSYTQDDKIQLLMNYARLHECVWYTGASESMPPDVISAASELQTPHAIFYFCESSRDSRTPEDRAPHLQTSKQELVTAFMNEIAGLDDTTLAVLVTTAFAGPDSDIFAQAFHDLATPEPQEVLERSLNALSDRLTKGFSWVKYSHPSYQEALSESITRVERVRNMFRKMTVSLARHSQDRLRTVAAGALAWNFQNLDFEERKLLRKLAQDPGPKVRKKVAGMLAFSFMFLDAEGKELVHKFAEDPKKEVRTELAFALAFNLENLDSDVKGLLLKLAEDTETDVRKAESEGLARNFLDLDTDGRKIFRKLATDIEWQVRSEAVWGMALNFDVLDDEEWSLLRNLTQDTKTEVRESAASALALKCNDDDHKGRGLLGNLVADAKPKVRMAVVGALASIFNDLDPEERELLKKLAEDSEPEVREKVAFALAENFQNLNPEERVLLRKFGEDTEQEVRIHAAWSLAMNQHKLDFNERMLIRKLAKDPEQELRKTVASWLADNFTNLDNEGRELLLMLAEDTQPEVKKEVTLALSMNFENLDHEGWELLRKLAKDAHPEVRANVAFGLARKFKDLDREGIELLDLLASDDDPGVRAAARKRSE